MFDTYTNPLVKLNRDLFLAAKEGNVPLAQQLIDEGADINASLSEISVLMTAADHRQWDMCKYLIENGASPNCPNRLGFAPLHVFAKEGQVDLIHLVAKHDGYMFRTDKQGKKNALTMACINNQTEAALVLLKDYQLPANTQDNEGNFTSHYAVMNNNVELLESLVEAGAPISIPNKNNETPITLAQNPELQSFLENYELKSALKASQEAMEKENPKQEEVKELTREEIINQTVIPGKRRILKA